MYLEQQRNKIQYSPVIGTTTDSFPSLLFLRLVQDDSQLLDKPNRSPFPPSALTYLPTNSSEAHH
jgi:hypothetical protein